MIKSTMELTPSDVCINIMPLFHIHGLVVNVLASISAGSTVICTPGLMGGVTAQAFLDRLAQEPFKPTWYSAVPTMHQLILLQGEALANQGQIVDHTLHRIRNCSAALLPAVSERMEVLFKGAAILPTYAMTESMPICSNPRWVCSRAYQYIRMHSR